MICLHADEVEQPPVRLGLVYHLHTLLPEQMIEVMQSQRFLFTFSTFVFGGGRAPRPPRVVGQMGIAATCLGLRYVGMEGKLYVIGVAASEVPRY